MGQDELYREVLPSTIMKIVAALMAAIAITFLVLCIYQLAVGPIGTQSAPTWLYLLMFLLFSAVTALVANMRKLTLSITSQGITVAYGLLKYAVSWDNVSDCYVDKASGISYGGFGLRITRNSGRWVLAYILPARPRVVLEMESGRYRRIVFSTEHTEEVLKVIGEQIRRQGKS